MFQPDDEYRDILSNATFIDLFAGIGGFRLALESFGADCVFSSEIDKHCRQTYKENFGDIPHGDIVNISEHEIPDHDILCAGFPCQPFSISGKQRGFEDEEKGGLLFEIIRITNFKKPRVIILENVKNYLTHDKGNTLKKTVDLLENTGYSVYYQLLNSSLFGVPQSRNRLFFVCFRNDLKINNFHFPDGNREQVRLKDICEPDKLTSKFIIEREDIVMNNDFDNYSLFYGLPLKPVRIGIVNKGGQGERIYHEDGHAITLSSSGGGVGAKTGLYLINREIRKLSPRECARLSGFPDSFILHNNNNFESYRQFGNTVVVDVVQNIILSILNTVVFTSQRDRPQSPLVSVFNQI